MNIFRYAVIVLVVTFAAGSIAAEFGRVWQPYSLVACLLALMVTPFITSLKDTESWLAYHSTESFYRRRCLKWMTVRNAVLWSSMGFWASLILCAIPGVGDASNGNLPLFLAQTLAVGFLFGAFLTILEWRQMIGMLEAEKFWRIEHLTVEAQHEMWFLNVIVFPFFLLWKIFKFFLWKKPAEAERA